MSDRVARPSTPCFLIALNEINLDFVQAYVDDGALPTFRRLLEQHGLTRTVGQAAGVDVEPWIQWVSVHTGLAYDEHGIFRLGDITERELEQIWEHLEAKHGCKVGAISPMNAANRTRAPAFFIPDPWTPTPASGAPFLQELGRAVAQGVQSNAQGGGSMAMYATLLKAVARSALGPSGPALARHALAARKRRYHRAILLDTLLADVFARATRRTRPDFASLFLNAGAHIQHYFLFNAKAYRGDERNPAWYIPPDRDPVFEVYQAYDHLLARLLAQLGEARMLIATGLHQDPVNQPVFYYRLRDHADFLNTLGADFTEVEVRMARDFLVRCATETDAAATEAALLSCRDDDGRAIMSVDNRGSSLFVTLTYPHEIKPDFRLHHAGGTLEGFADMVVFSAIKNGDHNGEGYLIDTQAKAASAPASIPLTGLFGLICAHFENRCAKHAGRTA
ncbi:MAG: alkaline phosphatase family protein [Geminicoccaceae bacterium]